MIRVNQAGSFDKTEKLVMNVKNFLSSGQIRNIVEKYAQQGVDMLASATPYDTGETSKGWSYTISTKPDNVRVYFHNSHVEKGVNIALILQYGHATRNGGYVYGIDYMSEPYQKSFQAMADRLWQEVRGL